MYYPRSFEYFAPNNLDEALRLLDEYRGEAVLLAGGQSLVPLLKLRLVSPSIVIDINKVGELSKVLDNGDYLTIGAMVRHKTVEKHEMIRKHIEALSKAASCIGDPAVRHMGTFGGNLCHSDPSSDYIPVCLALGASVKLRSIRNERVIPIEQFVKGSLQTDLKPNEILTEVNVQKVRQNEGAAFLKHEVVPGDFAIVNMAAYVKTKNGNIQDIRIAVGGLVPKAIRLNELEQKILDGLIKPDDYERMGNEAASMVSPQSDWRSSSDYRRHLVKLMTPKVFRMALEAAKRGG